MENDSRVPPFVSALFQTSMYRCVEYLYGMHVYLRSSTIKKSKPISTQSSLSSSISTTSTTTPLPLLSETLLISSSQWCKMKWIKYIIYTYVVILFFRATIWSMIIWMILNKNTTTAEEEQEKKLNNLDNHNGYHYQQQLLLYRKKLLKPYIHMEPSLLSCVSCLAALDHYTMSAVAVSSLYTIYADYIFNFANEFMTRLVTDIIIRNRTYFKLIQQEKKWQLSSHQHLEQFPLSSSSSSSPSSSSSLVMSIKISCQSQISQLLSAIQIITNHQYQHQTIIPFDLVKHRLHYFSYISAQIRSKMLQLDIIFDTLLSFLLRFATIILIFCCLVAIYIVQQAFFDYYQYDDGYHHLEKRSSFSSSFVISILWCTIDSLLISYCIWNGIRITIVALYCLMMCLYPFRIQLNEAITKIDTYLSTNNNNNKKQYLMRHPYGPKLFMLQRTYIDTYIKMKQLNHNPVSRVMFLALACSLPSNVYGICLLTFRHLIAIELLIGTFVIILQIVALNFVAQQLIQFSMCLHSRKLSRVCVRVQQMPSTTTTTTASININMKYKMAILYEIVHTRRKFHFTVGTIGKFTKLSFIKFTLTYSAYLMYAFQFKQNM